MTLAIEMQNLHKRFGDLHAVQGVSLTAQTGEILSLLGPNGGGITWRGIGMGCSAISRMPE